MPVSLRYPSKDDEGSVGHYRRPVVVEVTEQNPDTVTLPILRQPAGFAAHPGSGANNAFLNPVTHVLKS